MDAPKLNHKALFPVYSGFILGFIYFTMNSLYPNSAIAIAAVIAIGGAILTLVAQKL